jgi:glycosyltransferase involved in cell wall biosynthesis
MKKVLILCAHRPNRSPSQRYRFEQYLGFLEQNGFNFSFSYLLDERDDKIFYGKGRILNKIWILLKCLYKRILDWGRFNEFDIIFIQREVFFLGASFFEKRAYHSGAYVIFDFDDSIWMADTSPANLKWEWLKRPFKFFSNVSNSHCVMAGNKYLAEKAITYNVNTIIVPTTINTEVHFPKPELRNSPKITIGWSGSISTIKHFETLVHVLKKIKERYKNQVCFKIIGQTQYSNQHIEVESIPWNADTEVDDLNSFDIGMMPLPDDEWARGKCGLKALSYMACGIPAIMSAVGVNNEIISHGNNGYLAENESEWYYLLCSLIEDKATRTAIGHKGRETVIDRYSVSAYQETYLDIFKNAGKS